MIERRRNNAAIVIQKAYRRFKNRKHYLIMRYKTYEIVANKKERRRMSVSREYKGTHSDTWRFARAEYFSADFFG